MLRLPSCVLQYLNMPKSTEICYMLWAVGVLIGLPLHFLYLGHYRQAALWFSTSGKFGYAGAIIWLVCDVVYMPYYVGKANEDVPPQQKLEPASPLMSNIRCLLGTALALYIHMFIEAVVIPDKPSVIWYIMLSPTVGFLSSWLVAGIGYGKITPQWIGVDQCLLHWCKLSFPDIRV